MTPYKQKEKQDSTIFYVKSGQSDTRLRILIALHTTFPKPTFPMASSLVTWAMPRIGPNTFSSGLLYWVAFQTPFGHASGLSALELRLSAYQGTTKSWLPDLGLRWTQTLKHRLRRTFLEV